jgi:hypothetical protein
MKSCISVSAVISRLQCIFYWLVLSIPSACTGTKNHTSLHDASCETSSFSFPILLLPYFDYMPLARDGFLGKRSFYSHFRSVKF